MFVGPDETGAYERAAKRLADLSVYRQVLQRHDAGEPDEAIFDWVRTLAEGKATDDAAAASQKAVGRVGRLPPPITEIMARGLLYTYQHSGSDAALGNAKRLVSSLPESLRKVPYVQ
jgi:hypothetical protein